MLLEAKSNLARLMATENLVVEERNVPTAYFDIKSRILTVPILNGNLSNYLYDLLLGHEVGHALETPATGWHDSIFDHKVNKDILNVCEDVRIEKKIKRKFPGLKVSFIRGYQELMDMDFFGVKGKDLNTLNFIDRINLHTKGGAGQGIFFSDEERELLWEVETTETFDEVVAIAKKIQEFMKEQLKEMEKTKTINVTKKKGEIGEEDDQDLESKIGEGEESDDDNDTTDSDSTENTSKQEKDDKEDADTKAVESGNAGGTGKQGSPDKREEPIESKTDKSFREKEKQLYDKQKRDCVYSEIPKLKLDNIVVDYNEIINTLENFNKGSPDYRPTVLKQNFIKFKNESNKIVSYLVKEFELRKNAEQQSRAKVSKTGELNMDKIHEYKITDDIFERMTNVPNGKSHGLVMFIDWSGSMHEHLHSTIKQLLNLVMFCKKVNIPFEVYAFTTQWIKNSREAIQKEKVGDIEVGKFALLNILSSKMTTKEYSTMSAFLLDFGTGYRRVTENLDIPDKMSLGGTPLNHSIIAAFDIIPEFRKNNKLQIVNAVFLTDGDSGTLPGRYSYIDPRTNRFVSKSELSPNAIMRSFIRDPITKAFVEVAYSSNYGGTSSQQTKALLTLLKQRADCNLMGFFIADSRSIRSAMEQYGNYSTDWTKRRQQIDEKMLQFRKVKHFIVEDFGYDEYYLIRSSNLDTDDEELTVNTTTTRGLVSAFSKYTEGKISSRVILNRFIRMIA